MRKTHTGDCGASALRQCEGSKTRLCARASEGSADRISTPRNSGDCRKKGRRGREASDPCGLDARALRLHVKPGAENRAAGQGGCEGAAAEDRSDGAQRGKERCAVTRTHGRTAGCSLGTSARGGRESGRQLPALRRDRQRKNRSLHALYRRSASPGETGHFTAAGDQPDLPDRALSGRAFRRGSRNHTLQALEGRALPSVSPRGAR